MDYKKLADMLFPNLKYTPQDVIDMYPKRELKQGAVVTRFAPSPTGFMHIGNLYNCLIGSNLAHKSDGVFFVRVEDTDQKRKVDGAIDAILDALEEYGIKVDEGATETKEKGKYGPYRQSERKDIYLTFVKKLVEEGKAYPCFCSEERLKQDRETQERRKDLLGYWGSYAHCRNLSMQQVEENLRADKEFAIRLKVNASIEDKIILNDLVKGNVKTSDNYKDVIIFKSSGLPPYNFAHAIDDHFMGTTHVLRGDEWLPSMPEHLQIFKALGFKPPKYVHMAPIEKIDEVTEARRKISKRKDPEAKVSYYSEVGYPKESVIEYLLTVANSNFEDWRKQNKELSAEDFKITTAKLSKSGALFDLAKLNDISKTVISMFTAEDVYNRALNFANYSKNEELKNLLMADKERSINIFNIERGGKKPRKDIIKWDDLLDVYGYFYKELYSPKTKQDFEFDYNKFDAKTIATILDRYADSFNEKDEKQDWFNKLKFLAEDLGFASDGKEYKANPENFNGWYADTASIVRVGLTGKNNTPDPYQVSKFFYGQNELKARIEACKKIILK